MSHNDTKLDWTVGYAEEQLQTAKLAERDRILNLLRFYWCGEIGCTKHSTNWPDLIQKIKGENK